MKRLIGMTSLSLAAVLMVTSLAGGQDTAVRIEPRQVTSSTSPQRDRTLPATFTTTGRVVAPPYCAADVKQGAGGDCLPLMCLPGVTDPAYCQGPKGGCPPGVTDPAYCAGACPPGIADPAYCVQPPSELLCAGRVTVSFRYGIFTISSRSVSLRPDCTYRSRVRFISRGRPRPIRLSVSARFEGNDYLLPKSAPVHFVQIG